MKNPVIFRVGRSRPPKIGCLFSFFEAFVLSLLTLGACNKSKIDCPNIVRNYKRMYNDSKDNLFLFHNSVYVHTIQNKILAERQFYGILSKSKDSIYRIDKDYIDDYKNNWP